MMIKSSVAFWIVVWGNFCFSGDYKIVTWSSPKECQKPSEGFATLQMFFKKQDDERHIPAACILDSSRRISLKNITESGYNNFLNKTNFKDAPNSFPRNQKGAFVVCGEINPLYAYEVCCKNNQDIEENFYVKYIHYGVTEKLLDMPECSVELSSDCVELSLTGTMFTAKKTIIDPHQVKMIRKMVQGGKIFVVNVQEDVNGEKKAYKVLQCENGAYIHWDGWWLVQFLRKYVEPLNGFDKAEDVTPEKEITINLSESKKYEPTYTRNKRIFRWIKGVSLVSSCALLYYVLQDKIHEVLGK